VVTSGINQAYGQNLQNLVDSVSAKITTQELTKLNSQVTVGQQDSDAVAKQWLKQNNLQPSSTGPAKAGPTIVVGSANFSEDVTLADIYADALSANGYPVSKKLQIGSREIYFPALKQGQINFVPDYAGTLLTFVDKSQTATTNPQQNNAALAAALQPQGLVVYQSAPAQDVNGFVVTGATASKYNLKTLSDLGKNA
jgi:osmoprotectant transport system substrate-binding protein